MSAEWEILALRHGTSSSFPLAALLSGAPPGAFQAVGWYFWLLRQKERSVLVDCGFVEPRLVPRWDIRGWADAATLLARLAIRPEQVSDVILTHGHWDHAGGVGLFPRTRCWLREEEWAFMQETVEGPEPMHRGVWPPDVQALRDLETKGRLCLVSEPARDVTPGVVLHEAVGTHTPGAQFVVVQAAGGPTVLASDCAFLRRNVTDLVPPAATSSPNQSLRALERILAAARGHVDRVVPGHDPDLPGFYPRVADDVFRVAPR